MLFAKFVMFNISDSRWKGNEDVKKVIKEKVETLSSDNIKDAILKKALGYEVKEIVEEYGIVDKELKLIKKKVNTKMYPPDLDAIAMMMDNKEDKVNDYATFSDEELLEEKERLVKLFKRLRREEKDAED